MPPASTDLIVRWNGPKIYEALAAERAKRGLTWKQVAAEIGPRHTPATLRRLQKAAGIGFPYDMEIFGWLGKPAADFVMAVPW